MIIYSTKESRERLKLPLVSEMETDLKLLAEEVIEKESGDKLLEWGAKLFYFARRKCLQIVNFASKFTIILVDVKVKDMFDIPNMMAMYLSDVYKNDVRMTKLLKRFFKETPFAVYSALKDKSIIATLNHTQLSYLLDGYRLYGFIENNEFQSRKLNYEINFNWIFSSKVDGRTDYFVSGEKFAELLKERYQ